MADIGIFTSCVSDWGNIIGPVFVCVWRGVGVVRAMYCTTSWVLVYDMIPIFGHFTQCCWELLQISYCRLYGTNSYDQNPINGSATVCQSIGAKGILGQWTVHYSMRGGASTLKCSSSQVHDLFLLDLQQRWKYLLICGVQMNLWWSRPRHFYVQVMALALPWPFDLTNRDGQ